MQRAILLQGKQLEVKDKVKYLGVIFNESMSFDWHAKSIRKKAYLHLNKIRGV